MADISIVKIKVRRGTNSDRKRVVLDEGEIGFTTDTQRLFIGDGNTLGGVNVANNYLGQGQRETFATALPYDMVWDTVEKNLFILSATNPLSAANWFNVGPRTDDTTVYYNINNELEVVDDSIGRTKLNADDIVYIGLSATFDGRMIVVVDNSTIKVNVGNALYVDSAVIPLSGLRQSSTGIGLDATDVKLANLNVVPGIAAIPGAVYNSLAQNQLFLLNEPFGSQLYYVMLKG